MIISKLIEALNVLKSRVGDIDVYMEDDEWGPIEINSVYECSSVDEGQYILISAEENVDG